MSRFSYLVKPFIFLIFIPFLIPLSFDLIFKMGTDIPIFDEIDSLAFVSVLYGLYPALLPTEKFFKKQGYSNVVLEYQFLKKFNFVVITLLVILFLLHYTETLIIIIYYLLGYNIFEFSHEKFNAFFVYSFGLLIIVSIGGILRFLTQVRKKEFRFYFAKGCCLIISEKKDGFDKMKYLMLLLSSYNKYLQKNLKMEINDMKKIYSVILCKETKIKNDIIKKICESLEYDKLSLANYLLSIYNAPDSEFYIKESILQKLKVLGAVIGVGIPILLSIIELIKG